VNRRRTGAGLLGILAVILLGQLITPEPWTYLWAVVPVAGAAAMLLAQTTVAATAVLPPLLALAAVFWAHGFDGPWGWCLVAGVLAAGALGVAEKRGADGPTRLWAFLPVVAIAVALPFVPGYREFVARVIAALQGQEARQLAALDEVSFKPEQRVALQQFVGAVTARQVAVAQVAMPTLLFAWVALLVHLAERMAHRLAELVKRPFGELVPFVGWKLPAAAVWLLIGGLALVALRDERALPSGLNLAASAGLAFGVQGLAVFKAMMSAQGMAPGLVLMLFVFAWFMLGPVLLVAATGMGLMDLWLDFRRLEPRAEEHEPEGGRPWK